MQLFNRLILNKQARLFDTKEFLMKAFLAVFVAELIGQFVPYIHLDMISVLFGMIMTLEPINLTGIRNGMSQLGSTILGAMVTGIVLYFVGFNIFATAIAVTLTLYISILINWKQFSAVAVFTSIYMTQYVQTDSFGNPSILATFQLRISALLTGVFIAIAMNFIFSIVGYRRMLTKRVYHLVDTIQLNMISINEGLEKESNKDLADILSSLPEVFNRIDWISNSINDYFKDPLVRRSKAQLMQLEYIQRVVQKLRALTHLNYDLCYRLSEKNSKSVEQIFKDDYGVLVQWTKEISNNLENKTNIRTIDIDKEEDKLFHSNDKNILDMIDLMEELENLVIKID